MKNILKYSVAALFGLGIVACTGDFVKMNTSDVQVNPDDLPLSSQCAEPMQYCYPPQQNMFQFWTNLTVDFYSGYFMTPNGNFTNGDMGENRGHSGGMYENHYLHVFNNTRRLIATLDGKNQPALAAQPQRRAGQIVAAQPVEALVQCLRRQQLHLRAERALRAVGGLQDRQPLWRGQEQVATFAPGQVGRLAVHGQA